MGTGEQVRLASTAVMASQNMNSMKGLMSEIGRVETRDARFFEVYSNRNVGAGVELIDSSKIKITLLWGDAMSLPHQGNPVLQATLTVQHNAGSFRALVKKSRTGWQYGSIQLAVWKSRGPIDEEVMRKAVSLVRNVFDNAV
jgi:hypothetical protein